MAPQAFRLDTPLSAQIPAFREISAPRAPCFEMNAFCVSAKSDAFMQFHTFPGQRNLAENSTLKRSGIQGEEQSSRSDRGFPPPPGAVQPGSTVCFQLNRVRMDASPLLFGITSPE